MPWICDALLSNHSIKAYGRDFVDFVQHMKAQGVDPLQVTADHVKLYKRALLEAGMQRTTVARRLSVLRGTYKQLAAKGLVTWETAQDIAADKREHLGEKRPLPSYVLGGTLAKHDQVLLHRTDLLLDAGDVVCQNPHLTPDHGQCPKRRLPVQP